jgi:heat-inducible transcriptional repressor
MAMVSELGVRERDVFRMVVEAYLDSGAPIGSRTISKLSALNLSPASIRNVMQDLEEVGLLAAPHTSAGRMPTETGLRLFVDGMMQAAELTEDEREMIERGVKHPGPVEGALESASATLSGLSACAGLVMVPGREMRVAHFAIVPLARGQALAVLVGDDGTVENRVLDIPPGLSPDAIAQACNYMSARLSGMTLKEAQQRIYDELRTERAALDAVSRDLVERGLALWSKDVTQRPVLIVRGTANLLDPNDLASVERVRQLLDEIEGQEAIASLLDNAREGAATKIFIGSENKLFALSGSSVIAAPYRGRDGRIIGVVGVIGPTRLNYARIVPMVDLTAATLTRLMG